MQLRLFCVANTFIVLAFKIPLILTIYGHVAPGNLNFFNYLQLYAILSDWDGVFSVNIVFLWQKCLYHFEHCFSNI